MVKGYNYVVDTTSLNVVMPRFWPRYIRCIWCIYCNDHGVELKDKAPPLIGNAMFWIQIVTDGISGHAAYIMLVIM